MDRTSILGDTIDYMKEVLERINNLQVEMDLGANELGLLNIFQNVKPEEMLIRSSPKVCLIKLIKFSTLKKEEILMHK